MLGLLFFGGSRLGNLFSEVFSGAATADDLREAAQAWKLASAYLLAFGKIGSVIGFIIMLKHMADPTAIGPAMAIALLTIFYGLVLVGVTPNS